MASSILVIVLLIFAAVWGFWLIFKRSMWDNVNLGKLISYFIGVALTLICVWLITSFFLPWWASRLISDTQQSQNVKDVETAVTNIWREVISEQPVVATAVPVQPTATAVSGENQETEPITSQSAGQRTHTVQSGETLYKLSKTYGVSVDAIQQANNLTGETIKVGQELVIPATP